METEVEVRQIKKQLRLAMNGIVSASMRDKGVDYKLNFGLTYPLIKRIASSHAPSAALAERLWSEDIRECRILAALLYPRDEFPADTADVWVAGITQPEIADYCCTNLFGYLPFATDKALLWIGADRELTRYTGFQLLTRLFMQGYEPGDAESRTLIAEAGKSLTGPSARVAVCALNCIRRGIRSSREFAGNALCIFRDGRYGISVYADLQAEYELIYCNGTE